MRVKVVKAMALNEHVELEFDAKDDEQLKVRGRQAFDFVDNRMHEMNQRVVAATRQSIEEPKVYEHVQRILGTLHGQPARELVYLKSMLEKGIDPADTPAEAYGALDMDDKEKAPEA